MRKCYTYTHAAGNSIPPYVYVQGKFSIPGFRRSPHRPRGSGGLPIRRNPDPHRNRNPLGSGDQVRRNPGQMPPLHRIRRKGWTRMGPPGTENRDPGAGDKAYGQNGYPRRVIHPSEDEKRERKRDEENHGIHERMKGFFFFFFVCLSVKLVDETKPNYYSHPKMRKVPPAMELQSIRSQPTVSRGTGAQTTHVRTQAVRSRCFTSSAGRLHEPAHSVARGPTNR